jgi:threonine/homoserine/homoserine lactone efflux protein
MKLLTSDQGTIILGVFAAASENGAAQTLFYLAGCMYGFTTFYTAASVYVEAWKSVPEECKTLLKVRCVSSPSR